MNLRKAPLWLLLLLLALCAGSIFFAVKQRRSAAERESALARLEAENRALRARAGEAPRQETQATDVTKTAEPAHQGRAGLSEAEMAARLDSVRMLSQVKDQLAAAKTSIAELQSRVQELEATADKAADENKRRAATEAELKESLAGANRIVEAMQTELKGKTERLVALETASRRTSDDMKSANDKIAKVTGWARDLEDLNRRREVYLNSLMRRYRDLTDQVRAMTIRLDNPQETARPSQSVDLPRLQNIVALAEEDLRQLASLNSQAARLSQKMRN